MNRMDEHRIMRSIDKLTDLICHNYDWCNECPLCKSQGDGKLTLCTAVELINTYEKNDKGRI